MRGPARRMTVTALAALALAGCTAGGADPQGTGDAGATASTPLATESAATTESAVATAVLADVDGQELGDVQIVPADEALRVVVDVEGMDPGFYAMHVHTVGLCEPESSPPGDPTRTGAFLSAGGHLGADESTHAAHAGDLPSLYVLADGTGHLETVTDGLTAADLLDDDGSAVMVHAGRDNFANIPERYSATGPDQQTLDTGDAGDRLACGVVE
ncbi:superoxide dismutase [Cellulomonas shaoxiangyii]|uniref:Superoxide dismutase [Cu-Zn] n=2 Tax=Cellulomonas shaoxiangyii TaxID=2566013 RepID=A0A4P7SIZ7_9CELL|nr:superoxide dismutase [Cellulomonas shaoxiangyii]TGY82997.1 superoxide dismutase [Cellulomonas shaoxiangyii]